MLLTIADMVARTSTAEYVHTVLRLALCNACDIICNWQHRQTLKFQNSKKQTVVLPHDNWLGFNCS